MVDSPVLFEEAARSLLSRGSIDLAFFKGIVLAPCQENLRCRRWGLSPCTAEASEIVRGTNVGTV